MKIKNVEQLANIKHTEGCATKICVYRAIKMYQYNIGDGAACWQVVKIGRLYYGYIVNAHVIAQ